MNEKPRVAFLVGFTRSGTTSLQKIFETHSQVATPKGIKELMFFNHDSNAPFRREDFLSSFEGIDESSLIVDNTPMYIEPYRYDEAKKIYYCNSSLHSLEIIRTVFPNAKILVSNRDPYSRYLSSYIKNYRQGKKMYKTSIPKQVEHDINHHSNPEIYTLLRKVLVAPMLRNLLEIFPKEKIHIIDFQKWTSEPKSTIKNMLDFLEIDNSLSLELPKRNTSKNYLTKKVNTPKLILKRLQQGRRPFIIHRNFELTDELRSILSPYIDRDIAEVKKIMDDLTIL